MLKKSEVEVKGWIALGKASLFGWGRGGSNFFNVGMERGDTLRVRPWKQYATGQR